MVIRMPKTRGRTLFQDDRAQVGIGTMIVFIATVLVAAIAAGVIINTAGNLQERASQTGQETTRQVSSNLVAQAVQANRSGPSGDLERLEMTVTLSPGALPVSLAQTSILISNTDSRETLNYSTTLGAGNFTLLALRDADVSMAGNEKAMTAGDLARISVDLSANSLELAERKSMEVVILPETGAPMRMTLQAPEAFGNSLVFHLR